MDVARFRCTTVVRVCGSRRAFCKVEARVTSHGSRSSNVDNVDTATSSKETPQKVDVKIRGQKLSVRSDRDPEFVQKLADHIDEKVSELQKGAPTVPLSKLLMLASMTVAEELFEARDQIDHLREAVRDRTDAVLELLDELENPDVQFDPNSS